MGNQNYPIDRNNYIQANKIVKDSQSLPQINVDKIFGKADLCSARAQNGDGIENMNDSVVSYIHHVTKKQ